MDDSNNKYQMLDSKIDKMDEKLDKIESSLGKIDVTLACQHLVLEEHIRRTNILEEELKPIKEHVSLINSTIKVVGVVIGSSSLIIGFLKYLKFI